MSSWGKCAVTNFNGKTYDVASLQCLPALFANVLNALFMFAGIVAVIVIIISGYRLIFSGGEAKQLDTARKTLTYAIGGLVLVFLSYLILNFIATVTGVQCILTFGPWLSSSCK